MSTSNEPGVYVKGNTYRVADTPSEAVALTFDGWKRQDPTEAPEQPEKVVADPDPSTSPTDADKAPAKTKKDNA